MDFSGPMDRRWNFSAESETAMKFHLPKRRMWRVAIYLVSTLLILLAVDLIFVQAGRHITPSESSTRITEPTLPTGRIDYLAANDRHFGAGVTPDNNALPLMIEALGPMTRNNQPQDWMTARLGMPPLPEKGDYYKDELDPVPGFPKAATEDDPQIDLEPLMQHAWTGAEHPRLAAWLAVNEISLARITEATKRPRYFFPFMGGVRPETFSEVLLPHLWPLRGAGNALVCRAMLKAGNHDFTGARDDLMATHRLAQLVGQGSTIVDRLAALAIDNRASAADAALAAEGLLDAAQAKAWLTALEQLPPLFGFSDAIDFSERYMFLDILQLAADKGLKKLLDFCENSPQNQPWDAMGAISPLAPMRYGRAMQVGNGWYDRLVAAANNPAGAERRDALAAVEKDFDAFVARTRPWNVATSSDWPITAFLPGLFKISERFDLAQAKRNLAITAMAAWRSITPSMTVIRRRSMR